jgi:ERF superfamily
VHRSSETFAALASALAKAQAHLVNPEKSLTATITTGRAGETERSFRYAPLSGGLEIVRKTLSEQEIAVIQTTAVDQASRMLNLTTLLAHSSGEWIASQWPVCSIAEIASPQRMGAALTYARRYALFTLVGIAGEDDLDAPDLCDGPRSPTPGGDERSPKPGHGQPPVPQRKPGNGQRRYAIHGERPGTLEPEQSAALRENLLTAVESITSTDDAAIWAGEALAAKNRLAAADAKLVEDAFEHRLSELAPSRTVEAVDDGAPRTHVVGVHETLAKGNGVLDQAEGIDKSVLTIATPRRYRNREHLRFVAQQACLICGRKQSDPHHLRYLQPRALGRKASDEFTVPLCRSHHRAVHRAGNEQAWWTAAGIDPVKVARLLWRHTRLDNPQEHHQAGLAAHPETRPIASAPDGTKESRSDSAVTGQADDGPGP